MFIIFVLYFKWKYAAHSTDTLDIIKNINKSTMQYYQITELQMLAFTIKIPLVHFLSPECAS